MSIKWGVRGFYALSRTTYFLHTSNNWGKPIQKRQNDKKASPSYLRDSEYIMEATDLDFSIQHQNRPRRQRRPDQSGVSNYRRIDSGGSDNSYYNYEPVNPRHKGKGKNCLRNIVQVHSK